ncbi:Peptide-N(4)-(N-acetyl-beta-glucosaminyl)asparagine amidase [Handroanthus impetiginosus]|uniref:Peptide-N(4)-(N-acetyl-beta-glucosaminyl)asparagine amidase n=1 Tax=Handroanthus impetiginosus TaxID=429701 RepID=A0A2G9I0Z5_9LAMI|nr:Peptide-N(4)-(N-acetyl-beta-glucosaminyl)asparagine amidase [Handroanthus impetiginosus]
MAYVIPISFILRTISIQFRNPPHFHFTPRNLQFSPTYTQLLFELARLLQAEGEAFMRQMIRPYVDQVLMYEDPHRQEEARRFAPADELKQKAMDALAKVRPPIFNLHACISLKIFSSGN